MPEPKITMYDAPRTIYYRKKGNTWPDCVDCHGETSRSYLTGGTWRPKKIAKSAVELITEQEYRDVWVVCDQRDTISRWVRDLRDPAKLRKIAEIVGYTGGQS